MKVLFVCDKYYPNNTAAANCVHEIIKHLSVKEIECGVINVTDDIDLPLQLNFDNEKIYNIIDVSKLRFEQKNLHLLSLATKAYMVLDKIKRKIFYYPINKVICREIRKKLKQISNEYDVIVPVVSNVNAGYSVMKYCIHTRKKYVLYQVDPIATNQVLQKHHKRLYDFENELYRNALAVITTPILADEKKEDIRYQSCNIIMAEFPNVRDLTVNIETANTIAVCSFCGYIYSGIRDCNYTLKLFNQIKDTDVKIKFAGAGQESLIEEYSSGSLKGKLEHVGRLSQEESIVFMQRSDFLINIGNAMLNQVPSKLFDYISTGLPIINVCKNADCPTVPYLKKYGLALNLVETNVEDEMMEQASSLLNFIYTHKGKKKTFEEITKIFLENTPEHVGEQFVKVLNKGRSQTTNEECNYIDK